MFTLTLTTASRTVVASSIFSAFADALAEGAEWCELSTQDALESGSWADAQDGRLFRGGYGEPTAFEILAAD